MARHPGQAGWRAHHTGDRPGATRRHGWAPPGTGRHEVTRPAARHVQHWLAMRRRLGSIAFGLFLLSLVLPALVLEQRPLFGGGARVEVMVGFQCLAIGFFLWPGWLANPLLIIAWLVGTSARGRARYLAVATVVTVLALISAVFAAFLLASLDDPRLISLHVGYYVWLASIVITLIDLILTPRTAPVDDTCRTPDARPQAGHRFGQISD